MSRALAIQRRDACFSLIAILTPLSALAHDVCTSFRRLTAPWVRDQLRLWQFACVWWGISLRLSTLAVLIALPTNAAAGNGRHGIHVRSLSDYLTADKLEENILQDPLLGLTLREDQRNLKSGGSPTGLLVVAVRERGPAANAGLAGRREAPKDILTAIIVIGSMFFPPAMMLLPIANLLSFELGGDLIIAADGTRVSNLLDYQNEMRDAEPGEIVYLTIVRKSMRKQVAVPIPRMGN